jgi:hypothetical protein
MIPIGYAPLESRQRPVVAEPRGVPYPVPARAQSDIRTYFEPEPRLLHYNPPVPEPRAVINDHMAPRYEALREM